MENTKELPIDQIQLLANVINKQNKMNLNECLELYTKDLLLELFDKHGYTIRKSWTKGKMIETLSVQILERFEELIQNADLKIISGLLAMIPKFNKPVTKEDINAAYYYAVNGYIYVLNNKQGEEILIIPKEIMNRLIKSLNADEMTMVSKREILSRVIRGLGNIYGVFSREQLLIVLEKLEQENNEFFANAQLVDSCITLSELSEVGYEEIDGYFMTETIAEENAYQTILEAAEGKPYYMPSLEEVMFYSEYEFDMRLPIYGKLKEFFVKNFNLSVPVVEEVMFNLSCVALNDSMPSEYLSILSETNIVFDDQKQVSQLMELVLELSNHTRKWANRGFKPLDFAPQNQEVKMSNTTVVNQSKKVGRNEPCPCGSGKKYKKCCGR